VRLRLRLRLRVRRGRSVRRRLSVCLPLCLVRGCSCMVADHINSSPLLHGQSPRSHGIRVQGSAGLHWQYFRGSFFQSTFVLFFSFLRCYFTFLSSFYGLWRHYIQWEWLASSYCSECLKKLSDRGPSLWIDLYSTCEVSVA
jgi:hypothetical protein